MLKLALITFSALIYLNYIEKTSNIILMLDVSLKK